MTDFISQKCLMDENRCLSHYAKEQAIAEFKSMAKH